MPHDAPENFGLIGEEHLYVRRVLWSLMGWSEKVGHVELSQVLSVESL